MSFMAYPPPRYGGKTGLVNARYRPADTDPDLVSGGADGGVTGASRSQRTHYLATGAGTGGEFGLYRIDMPPLGRGPRTHFHRTISESFFILSGTVNLFDGERWIDATPGDFLYVPIGGLHAFHNSTDEPASLLLLFAPGAPREGYFEGVTADLADMSEQEREEFFLLHDNHWVDD
ncbi:Cupin domain protein [Actinomadura rubteroloni]|uniref:Cupin domain protein n=1 Tax=Actinomadura rubteroloni TaxID=1926885 RepID=A0A2P4UEP1_9ACTN|nr:cupin domain-containing protein [Actinomadura rubteroloni]POM23530.1 Cupin domain protein [Actinomadura rubteroloni]